MSDLKTIYKITKRNRPPIPKYQESCILKKIDYE